MDYYTNQSEVFFDRDIVKNKRKVFNAHYHPNYELYYLVKGHTKYFIGNEIYYLEKNNFIFVPKNMLHKTDSEESIYSERIIVNFSDDLLEEEMQKYLKQLNENKLVFIDEEKLPKIKEILKKMEHEKAKKYDDYKQMFKVYLYELLISISRYRTTAKQVLTPQQLYIKQISDYIKENYEEDLSLAALSKMFSISKSCLCRKFKAATGLGINEYITNIRIMQAESLLAESKLSMTEVAHRCGFNDSNYFTTVFKRIKGITPYKYSGMYREPY